MFRFLPLLLYLRLKEILAEALAAGSDGTMGRPGLGSDSPANMAIKLMDCLIMGEEVCVHGACLDYILSMTLWVCDCMLN